MAKLKLTKVKSHIGTTPKQKKNLLALGLKKMNSSRVHDDNAVIRGMIDKVHHLIKVETAE
jgi:large subunit ribosomal protein L30